MADPSGPTNPGGASERIIQTDLRNEMSRSYMEYAVSYTHLTLPTNREV